MPEVPAGLLALSDRYRIERELGQGGMATVYLAEDVRHHRKVAVKVLHPELSAVLGGDRFLKEIELTANLQHPHVLPLFDSGAADGLLYYVMPFVEGESLRARLNRDKQLPIAEAVRIASEVASALDYAHRRGVVHRDIKPENILLHDGRPLVADFGIALAVQQAGGSRMTQTGMSLGTPAYMSPEQAMGEREISARSDLYALGCVTYEMLAGEPPFTGPTAQAIVARVMTEVPRSLRAQRHTIPEPVEAAVFTALEKLPADRFDSAAEFAEALQGGRPARRGPGAGVVKPTRTLRDRLPHLLGAALLLTTALAVWGLFRTPPTNRPSPVVRYNLMPGPEAGIRDITGSPVAVSPDGSYLIYVGATLNRSRQLFRWDLDGGTPTPLTGTENAAWPFFSPEGDWVGFFSSGLVKKLSVRDGSVVTIGEAGPSPGSIRAATWTAKGDIVLATSTGLRRIPASGGTESSTPFRNLSDSLAIVVFPDALPDGEHVVATMIYRVSPPTLGVVNLATGVVTSLGQLGSNPRYVETGHLAYTTPEGALVAAPFDPGRRRITGRSRQIAQRVLLGAVGIGKFGISRNGTVVYLQGGDQESRQLLRVDRRGGVKALEVPSRAYQVPRISPDGRRIVMSIGPHPNPPLDLWIHDLALGTLSRITFDSTATNPEWSWDGKQVVHRKADTLWHAVATSVDGSAPPRILYTTSSDLWEVLPTRSGDTLITRELRSAENDRDILLLPLKSGGQAIPWAAGPRVQAEAALSPDGRWLAYTSEESGTAEVYVRAFPGPGPRYQISVGGGGAARWNPRGGELFYLSADSVFTVPLRSLGTELAQGRRRALFANRFAQVNWHAPYDVAPDGSWFVFTGSTAAPTFGGFRLVLNWFEQPWTP